MPPQTMIDVNGIGGKQPGRELNSGLVVVEPGGHGPGDPNGEILVSEGSVLGDEDDSSDDENSPQQGGGDERSKERPNGDPNSKGGGTRNERLGRERFYLEGYSNSSKSPTKENIANR